MKLSEEYTEIVGITHKSGEEECHNLMPKVTQLEAVRDALRIEQWRAIELLVQWASSDKDEIDLIIHTDRFLSDKCNCNNELPPCKVCELQEDNG